MAETTPLLPGADRPPYDLSIFLRVCHSSWSRLVQKVLVAVRASIAAYLSVAFALAMFHEINCTQRGKQFAFEASNISLAIQTVYYWITTVSTSPQLCINLLIFLTVLGTATFVGTLRSIACEGTGQEKAFIPI